MKPNLLSLSLCSLLAMDPCALAAEVPIPRDTVGDRIREELQPLGMHVGTFTVLPGLDTRFVRSDNIYAQPDNQVSDTIAIVSPFIDVSSNWSRHSLSVNATADLARFNNNASENYTDTSVEARGRITISRGSGMRLSARLDSLHEDRFSPDDRNGFSPTEYKRTTVTAGYERAVGRVSLRIDAGLSRLNYDDVAGPNGEINNDDRDRRSPTLNFRAGYSPSGNTEFFVRGAINEVEYLDRTDDNGFERSSRGGEIAVGAALDLTELTSAEAFIGYTSRDYDDARFDDIDATWFGGTVAWRVTGLTTVSANGSRRVADTTLSGSGGYVSTRYAAAVDHELLRNLVLHLSVYRQENDFAGIERRDDILGTHFQVNYMMNRNFALVFDYDTRDQDINQPVNGQPGFDNQTFSLRLTSQR